MLRKRGRPVGSFGIKKRQAMAELRQRAATPANVSSRDNNESDVESFTEGELPSEIGEELAKKLEKVIDIAISAFSSDLKNLKGELKKELTAQTRKINKLEKENKELKQRCHSLEEKVSKLESESSDQFALINKQERFSRRNNVRIVGYATSQNENCIQIAKNVFREIGLNDCYIERAHRDGKIVEGRSQHILVKVSFHQDKLFLLKHARVKLQEKPYFLTDDLTRLDLMEKKKWKNQVTQLYRTGTKLRFAGGVWRQPDGRPYKFAED
ncbi:LINE-1 retrotransposable element ORF1 protein [Holothuria leucospilota]|uniref:LINE-1 retrotransposable element ORF1 protein n=1 Tax=Holothuria leucospilota TaxID=206669 RepID=A0A9Q0YFI9_HOLLE|nr:LINE-1 retrotransposable element ORF1 protein [Holothuria leucospilota]